VGSTELGVVQRTGYRIVFDQIGRRGAGWPRAAEQTAIVAGCFVTVASWGSELVF